MEVNLDELKSAWHKAYPNSDPRAEQLKVFLNKRWLRFYTLPGAKRYAETKDEQHLILARYNSVIERLNDNSPFYVMTCIWSDSADVPQHSDRYGLGEGTHWLALQENPDDSDSEDASYRHIFVNRIEWTKNRLDKLLTAVANDECAGVIICPTSLQWLFHPYDGGMDIITNSNALKQELQEVFIQWIV